MGQFGEYEIFATADLGDSWFSKVYENYEVLDLIKMDFISGDTGYFVHNTSYTNSQLYRTSNYLTTYQACFSIEDYTYRDSEMINYNDIFLIDSEAKIFHLDNDTLNLIYDLPVEFHEWDYDPTISATKSHYLFINCKSYPNGSYNNDLILNSYDGGYSWDTSFISNTIHLNTIEFASDSLGFAVGNGGIILRTLDAGQTWENMNSGSENDMLCIDFMDEQTWMVGGTNATLLLTEDGGETWNEIYLPPSNSSVRRINFPEKNEIVFISHIGLQRTSIYNLTSVSKQIKTSENFNIYPNPAKDQCTIEIKGPKLLNTYAEFYNLVGEKVFSHFMDQEKEIFDCSTFPKGIYLVKVLNQGEYSIQRLVVQ